MPDLDALELLLAEFVYDQDDWGDDPLNLNGWLNDIDAEDATIEEMLLAIIKDDDQRAEIQSRIDFLD
jgi:hypothetical protein